jgi:hypothetical protein
MHPISIFSHKAARRAKPTRLVAAQRCLRASFLPNLVRLGWFDAQGRVTKLLGGSANRRRKPEVRQPLNPSWIALAKEGEDVRTLLRLEWSK